MITFLKKIKRIIYSHKIKPSFFKKIVYLFFIRFMFKNIQNTKPIKSDNKSETEVHSLVCHRDLYVYLYSIKSFIKNTTNNCSIIVHDDGSLTEDDIRMLKKHIEGLKIYNVKEADKIVIPKLEKYPLIKKLRSENVLLRKLTDFYFLS